MDLNRIAVFVRVAEAGSFTSAAAALHLPKSSVSRSVAHLEEELDVRLFQRTTRKIALTAAGEAYFRRARAAMTALTEATDEVARAGVEPRGTVRVTAPVDSGSTLFADTFARFVKKHPEVHVDMVLTNRRVDLVEEGFDIALRAGRLSDSSLIARKLMDSSLAIYASNHYVKRRGKPKKLADLASHDCILFRGNEGRSTWTLSGPKGVESVTVTGPISADDLGFVRRIVAQGIGIGLLPHMFGDQDRLMRLLPEWVLDGSALYLVMPSKRQVPARVALLRDFLLKELRTA